MDDAVKAVAQAAIAKQQPQNGFMGALAQTWPVRMAKDLFSAATLPGDVYQGNVSMYGADGRTNPEVINRSADLTNFAAGGAVPMAQRGAAGVFGGRLSATADLRAMQEAEGLLQSGASRGDVWANTGWFKGQDGMPRYEIPDAPATLTGKPFEQGRMVFGEQTYKPQALSDVMRHPEAYKAYPELAEYQVHHSPAQGLDSSIDPMNRLIVTNMDNPAARESLLHEMQHAVQNIEGFAPGGSPGRVGYGAADDAVSMSPAAADAESARQMLLMQREKAWDANPNQIDEIHKQFEPLLVDAERAANQAWYDAYLALPGEVEARTVADRSMMGHNSRRGIAPWEAN